MGIYRIALVGIYLGAAAIFVTLHVLEAPYGRFARSGWGPTLRARWAWLLMELPSAVSMFVMAGTGELADPVAVVFLAAWQAHYLYRSLIYPFLLPAGSVKNMPLVLAGIAVVFNVANGFANGYHFFHGPGAYGREWLADPRFIAGMLLFAGGAALHLASDRTLRRLRSSADRSYRIPHGGAFRWVSCPNYLGEIIEWCGFALAAWSPAALGFALFTIANLLPRARSHHRWYRATFPDYPRRRRALIPGVL